MDGGICLAIASFDLGELTAIEEFRIASRLILRGFPHVERVKYERLSPLTATIKN